MSYKFRLLEKDEIEVRVGNVIKNSYKEGANLLLYKNARVDMDILDETVGAENWQRGHTEIKGNLYCNVSIYDDKKNQWVTKQDCGVESNTEKEKGEASDSFKRACVNLGIGRELYSAPQIFVKWETEQIERNGKKVFVLKYNPTFYVDDITYNDKRKINSLRICAKNGKDIHIVFDWKNELKPLNRINEKQKDIPAPILITEEEAMNYVLQNGKYEGNKLSECNESYIRMCAEKCNGKLKEMAKIVLSVLERKDMR